MIVKKFALFERNDIDIINYVDDLYIELLKYIRKDDNFNGRAKNGIKKIFLYEDSLYLYLENFTKPMFICLSDRDKYSFGMILVNDIKVICLWIPFENKEDFEFEDIVECIENDEKTIKHELTHLYDHLKNGKSMSETILKSDEELEDMDDDYVDNMYRKYFNDSFERNAYFIQGASMIKKQLENGDFSSVDSFDKFLSIMKSGNGELFYNSLIEKNKKKYVTRCYLLFKDFRKKYIS